MCRIVGDSSVEWSVEWSRHDEPSFPGVDSSAGRLSYRCREVRRDVNPQGNGVGDWSIRRVWTRGFKEDRSRRKSVEKILRLEQPLVSIQNGPEERGFTERGGLTRIQRSGMRLSSLLIVCGFTRATGFLHLGILLSRSRQLCGVMDRIHAVNVWS